MISQNTLGLLEFPKLLRLISNFANSEASKASALEIQPLADKAIIEKRLGQISEVRKMSHEGTRLELYLFPDISRLIVKIRPDGAVL